MPNLKIGIVEDDLLIAESIVITLQQIGYTPTVPVRSFADAIRMIETDSPDLLLLDIVLEGSKDGIALAAVVNKDYDIPFIFLTANSDRATIERAKEVKPHAYLVKPFNENDLYSSIEIAMSNFHASKRTDQDTEQDIAYLKDVIFIKEGHLFHKVEIKDILYIESDNVYLNLYTARKNYLVRSKLEDFISGIGKSDFVRVHRSFAINLKHLETIHELNVRVGGKEVPMQKVYRQELINLIKTIR